MKISFIFQMQDLGIMFAIGFAFGIIYGIINITNSIKEIFLVRIICDILFTITYTLSFVILLEKINMRAIRFYLLVGYLLGFLIERISLGKLFAKYYKKMYNKLKLIYKKFKNSKLGSIIFK